MYHVYICSQCIIKGSSEIKRGGAVVVTAIVVDVVVA